MSPTESRAAAIFFADLLVPLRRAHMRRGSTYLDGGPPRASYWGPVLSRTGGMERLSASECNLSAALRQLQKYWSEKQERDLLQLVSELEALSRALSAPEAHPQSAPTVPEFVYPLY